MYSALFNRPKYGSLSLSIAAISFRILVLCINTVFRIKLVLVAVKNAVLCAKFLFVVMWGVILCAESGLVVLWKSFLHARNDS